MSDTTYETGAVVTFTGGLGGERYGTGPHTGIVNGPTQFTEGGAWVPVYVRTYHRAVLVASTNITEVVRFS